MLKFKSHLFWCRHTSSDLWGNILFSHKKLKIFFSLYKLPKRRFYKQFVFKINYKKARQKRRKLTEFSTARLDRHKIFAYYLINGPFLKYMAKKALQSGPHMMRNLVRAFDGQLYMLLWRNKFYLSPFFAKRAIEAGFIQINGQIEHFPSRIIGIGDLVTFTVKPLLILRLLWFMDRLKCIDYSLVFNIKTMGLIYLKHATFKNIIRYFDMPKVALHTNLQWF